MLQDIAVLTGGQAISEDLSIKLESVTLNMLGRAQKLMIEKENTPSSTASARRLTRRHCAPARHRSAQAGRGLYLIWANRVLFVWLCRRVGVSRSQPFCAVSLSA
jgi:hypothetical protein